MKNLIELLTDKDNVAATGNKYIFPVKVNNEKGEFSHFDDKLGIIKLYQVVGRVNRKAFINEEERYYSQIGTKKGLNAILREIADQDEGTIAGRLKVLEIVESEITPDIEEFYFNSKSADDPKEKYRKKAGKDGDYLTHKGEQIFRFVKWVFNNEKDVLLEHDEE